MSERELRFENILLTILKFAHLNAWDWDLKSKTLTIHNPSDKAAMKDISPLMALDCAVVPNYPQVLIDKGIICGNAVEMINEYELEIYHAEDGQEISFRLPFTNVHKENVWLQFHGIVYRDSVGDPDRAVGYYTDITSHLKAAENGEYESILNSELEKQRYMNMIKGLTLEFANVFLVNLKDETYVTFKLDDVSSHMVKRQLEKSPSYREVMAYYIQEFVVEEDREMMQCLCNPAVIRRRLQERGFFSLSYRSFREGELVYCEVLAATGNTEEDEILIGFKNVDLEVRRRQVLEKELREDSLSGLLNRRAFKSDVLNQLYCGNNRDIAFLFMDIDHFKSINDTLGHAVGDRAITDMAEKLEKIFRKSDIIGRYGGDEFCVFLEGIPMDVLVRKLDECLKGMHTVYTEKGNSVEVTVSIGVAYFKNYTKADIKWLQEQSDAALYEAKTAGRNRYVIKEFN